MVIKNYAAGFFEKRANQKAGQMKINQLSFMLIGVTIFLALVGIFGMNIWVGSLHNTKSTLEEENAFLLATKLANSPEFSCGEAFGSSRDNCIDLDKVMALKAESEKYEDFWGIYNIEIRKIYPRNNGVLCTFQNYPNCDVITLFNKPISGGDTGTFVALCRKELREDYIQDRCNLGKLYLSYEGGSD
jgi:hypothetical protein